MAKKKYKFPKGTTKISAKEIKEALCNYEVVEIPGSVHRLTIKTEEFEDDIVTKQLILNEGTESVVFGGMKSIDYNVPDSLVEIHVYSPFVTEEVGFKAMRVLCLPPTLRKAYGLCGPEYLQAYSTSEVRWFDLPNLKHYNYLGERMSAKQYIFEGLPTGCVIHVESKKMARSVLKKIDVEKVFVIPDAAEWKDFPADKLSLTFEEYAPESRMLPEQKKMREELEQERIEREKQKQE